MSNGRTFVTLMRTAAIVYLLFMCCIVVLPIAWMALASLKNSSEIVSSPSQILPVSPSLSSYQRLAQTSFMHYLLNSAYVGLVSAVTCTVIGSIAAYGVVHTRGILGSSIRLTSLISYTLSPVVLVIPYYTFLRSIDSINTLHGLVLSHVGYCFPFALWNLIAFFSSIPRDAERRAAADGLNQLSVLLRVFLPLALPGILSTAIFSFMLSWNDYVFARVIVNRNTLKTIGIGIEDMFSSSLVDWGMIMAASTIVAVPCVLIVWLSSRQIKMGSMRGWQ